MYVCAMQYSNLLEKVETPKYVNHFSMCVCAHARACVYIYLYVCVCHSLWCVYAHSFACVFCTYIYMLINIAKYMPPQ